MAGSTRSPNDISSVVTAAEEVRRDMLARIGSGVWRPGERISPERELAAQMSVSRGTLRQALAALEEVGALRRVPGRGGGTFVAAAKIERNPSSLIGVPALLRSQGMVAGTRVLSASVETADPLVAGELDLTEGALVFRLLRVRLADGSPLSLEEARLPAHRFPGLLELPLGESVYELLDAHYGVRPGQALERREVVTASPDEALVLDVETGAPLISILRTTLDHAGEPIEYSYDLFRSDRTRLVVRTDGRNVLSEVGTGRIVELRSQIG